MKHLQLALTVFSCLQFGAMLLRCQPVDEDAATGAALADAGPAAGLDAARTDAGQPSSWPDAARLDSVGRDADMPLARPDSGTPQQHNGCPHFRCPLGMACIAGECGADNCVVQGCPGGASCDAATGDCVLPPECASGSGCDAPAEPPICSDDGQCASGARCLDGHCFFVHCVLTGCPDWATCDAASGLCQGLPPCYGNDAGVVACSSDLGCPAELYCVGGHCRAVACAAGVCPALGSCQRAVNRCVRMAECTCGTCGTPQGSGG